MQQPHVIAHQVRADAFQIRRDQMHQKAHLFFGPLPVLHTEGIQGQVFDADIDAMLSDNLHRFAALFVTAHPGQTPLLRPPAVSVHNNGDMPRNGVRMNAKPLGGDVTFLGKHSVAHDGVL
jgi:hypothetical protein